MQQIQTNQASTYLNMKEAINKGLLLLVFVCLSLVNRASSSIGIETSDCNTKYACFVHPSSCAPPDCELIAKWMSIGDQVEFMIATKLDAIKSKNDMWLAIGFSKDQLMGEDCVVLGKFYTNDSHSHSVEHYYNEGKSTPTFLNTDKPKIGLSDVSFSRENHYAAFSFKRAKAMPAKDMPKYYDLNEKFYLLIAFGKLQARDRLAHHSFRIASGQEVGFQTVEDVTITVAPDRSYFAKIHASLMIFVWIFVSSLGILIARYYKFLLPESKFCNVQFWFTIHRSFMITVPILSIAAFVAILAYRDWTWVDVSSPLKFSHSIIGATTIAISILQPIMGFFRPDKGSPIRPLFNGVHRTFGIVAYFSSIVAICLGEAIMMEKGNWTILTGWLVWLIGFCIFLEVFEFKIRKHKTAPTTDDNQMKIEEKSENNEKEKWKSFLLMVHLVLSMIFTVSLILVMVDVI